MRRAGVAGPGTSPTAGAAGEASGCVDEQDRAAFAEFLSSARRRADCSLQQIAAATKISPRHLAALETGRIETLPGGVYRRAIVRDYAGAVGLDPLVVLERFDRTFGSEATLPDLRELQEKLAALPSRGSALGTAWNAAVERLRPAAAALPGGTKWVLPTGAAVLLAIGAYAVSERLVRRGGAEPPLMAAVLPEIERQDVHLPAEPLARSRAPATAGAPGLEHRLVITSQPAGARVTVDGIGWGVTPLTIHHLPAGDKVVRLTKDGYVARERRVRVGGDSGTAAVRVTLRPRS